jgi:2'-5' RNA ligase
MQAYRCFIALELSRIAIDEIENIQNLIKKKNLFYGKLTESENLHLTLKFLGEITEEKLKQVQEKLKSIKFQSFEANLGELGLFSNRAQIILWLKLQGKGIFELQKQIDKELKPLFPLETRFMSHITIARIKKLPDKKAFLEYIKNLKHTSIKFKVAEFVIKKSELKPEGPVYTNIDKFKAE